MNILVVAAHADDIEFGAAGSIARWVREGHQVTYCIVTDGGAGSNQPDTDLTELIRIRREEQCRAAEVVGVRDVRFLNYKDGSLQPTLELRRDITRLIRELKAERVVTFDPTTIFADMTMGEISMTYINHPDHRATGEAAVYAAFPSAGARPIFPELLLEGYEPVDVKEIYLTLAGQPNTYIDISETFALKLEALRCHPSQIGDGERVTQMITHWDAETGKKIGAAYAEDFRVLRLVPPDTAPPSAD